MTLDREAVPARVSELLDHRPVRWGEVPGDYDGRQHTLEVFDADAGEQRGLLRRLRDVRGELDAAAGGPMVIVFHTRAESRRLYADVIDTWNRRLLARLVTEWMEERADIDPPIEAKDIEPLRLRGAA
jgi:hypothetical protein